MKHKQRKFPKSFKRNHKPHVFPNAREDVDNVSYFDDSEQTCSPSYRLAYDDLDFIMRDDLRSARLQLELLKPEIAFNERNIDATIVIFGGSRFIEQKPAEKNLNDLKAALKKEQSMHI